MTQSKPSSKCISQFNGYKTKSTKFNRFQKPSFLKSDSEQNIPTQYTFQNFNQHLKKSLHVQPLPVILPKKIDINEYQKEKNNQRHVQLKDKIKEFQNMRDMLIKTNKVSIAMDTLLMKASWNKEQNNNKDNNIYSNSKDNNIHNNNNHHNNNNNRINTIDISQIKKATKLLLSRQHNSSHYSFTQNQHHLKQPVEQSQSILHRIKSHHNHKRVNNKQDCQYWQNLIEKIKHSSKNSPLFQKQCILDSKSLQNRFNVLNQGNNNINNGVGSYYNEDKCNDTKSYKKIKTELIELKKNQRQEKVNNTILLQSKLNNKILFEQNVLNEANNNKLLQSSKLCQTLTHLNIQVNKNCNSSSRLIQNLQSTPVQSIQIKPSVSNNLLMNKCYSNIDNKQNDSKIMRIKLKKLNFQNQCEKRNQVMNYSMFNFKKLS